MLEAARDRDVADEDRRVKVFVLGADLGARFADGVAVAGARGEGGLFGEQPRVLARALAGGALFFDDTPAFVVGFALAARVNALEAVGRDEREDDRRRDAERQDEATEAGGVVERVGFGGVDHGAEVGDEEGGVDRREDVVVGAIDDDDARALLRRAIDEARATGNESEDHDAKHA